ncbi:Uncharacterized conserved protein YjiS, DUF1127 family [Shimia gijangensis]|uniref:Uncharacterized conserved protein YjiS, DUF1127 family n=1 Tax=Shimia gijangensis TaxID=1470563 RepID=A0A1M6G0R2_9RHOB|nr:DUF1127 domain-containing protein [Shimia gijangensis]SHJ03533.1 Uncharacterized conserved protein YjiS, DUF1127 family [Shimia gijangensis]
MAYASTYTTAQQGTADRLVGFASNLVERFKKARAFRKTMNELYGLTNAQLADMGLNRSMIRRVAYQAVYEV